MSSFLSHRRKAFRGGVAFDVFGNASRDFDGTNDDVDLGDSDTFSFGDGSTTDSPFSVCAWVKMDDATNFRTLSKFQSSTSEREWFFQFGADDRLYLLLYDDDGSSRIGRRTTTQYTANQQSWLHAAATYDGSGSASGISLYTTTVAGTTSQDDTTNQNLGTYSAMHNTAASMKIGRLGDFTTAGVHYADGNIADVRLYNKELTSVEVQNIADGTHVTDSLVGWWLDDDDDVLDNAGTNDGTNNGSTYDNTDAPNL